LHAVGDHGLAERAADRDRLDASIDDLLGAVHVDPLLRLFLDPHPAPTGAATKAVLAVAVELDELALGPERARQGVTRSVVDAVPAAEVARVVVGQLLVEGVVDLQPA